jgi:hypothetical protein
VARVAEKVEENLVAMTTVVNQMEAILMVENLRTLQYAVAVVVEEEAGVEEVVEMVVVHYWSLELGILEVFVAYLEDYHS